MGTPLSLFTIFTNENTILLSERGSPAEMGFALNPIALRMAKILQSFGCFECSRVKGKNFLCLEGYQK